MRVYLVRRSIAQLLHTLGEAVFLASDGSCFATRPSLRFSCPNEPNLNTDVNPDQCGVCKWTDGSSVKGSSVKGSSVKGSSVKGSNVEGSSVAGLLFAPDRKHECMILRWSSHLSTLEESGLLAEPEHKARVHRLCEIDQWTKPISVPK